MEVPEAAVKGDKADQIALLQLLVLKAVAINETYGRKSPMAEVQIEHLPTALAFACARL